MALPTYLNLTLPELRRHVRHAAQLNVSTAKNDPLDEDRIINLAGDMFYNCHQWKFRERPPVNLSLVANQDHVDLPPDFGEQTGYQVNGLNFGVAFTTIKAIMDLRATAITVSQNYWYAAIVYPAQVSVKQPPPPARMEIWPTPSAAHSERIQLSYRARWIPIAAEDDVAPVPTYAQGALIQVVRAFSAGYLERLMEPQGGLDAILRAIMEGPIFEAAVTADGLTQSDYGPMTNGAIQATYPRQTWRSASASPISGPS